MPIALAPTLRGDRLSCLLEGAVQPGGSVLRGTGLSFPWSPLAGVSLSPQVTSRTPGTWTLLQTGRASVTPLPPPLELGSPGNRPAPRQGGTDNFGLTLAASIATLITGTRATRPGWVGHGEGPGVRRGKQKSWGVLRLLDRAGHSLDSVMPGDVLPCSGVETSSLSLLFYFRERAGGRARDRSRESES